jgi:hypothetical protein
MYEMELLGDAASKGVLDVPGAPLQPRALALQL